MMGTMQGPYGGYKPLLTFRIFGGKVMARTAQDLSLPEQILLLALRDEKGTIDFHAGIYTVALGGAILAELLIAERIRVGEDGKKLVEAVASRPCGDAILDECLTMISTAPRRRSATAWVSRFAGIRRLKHRIAGELCRKGILRNSEDQVLLIFTRKVYPTIDAEPERRLVERMSEAIFGDGTSLDPRVGLVVTLAQAAKLLPIHFPKKELSRRKARLQQISKGDLVGSAARSAVQAAQSAVMAAVMASVIAATASSAAR